jgi:hypothetical protein
MGHHDNLVIIGLTIRALNRPVMVPNGKKEICDFLYLTRSKEDPPSDIAKQQRIVRSMILKNNGTHTQSRSAWSRCP